MKNLFRVLGYVRKYSGYAVLNTLFNILTVIFSLFSVVMIIPFLQLLFDKIKVGDQPVFAWTATYFLDYFKYLLSIEITNNGQTVALIKFCVLVAVIFFFKNLFRFLAVYFLSPIRSGSVRDIRSELYAKILTLPLSYYSKERKGDIISRVTDDVKEVEISIISFLEVSVREPLTIIIFLAALLVFSPQLTAFVLIMLLVTGVIIGRVGKSLKRQSADAQSLSGRLLSLVDETLGGLRIVHAFNAENFMTRQFGSLNQRLFDVNRKMNTRRELSSPLTEFLAICVVCSVLYYGGMLVLGHKGLEAATFIGFMLLFAQLIPPAKNFSTAFYNIRKGLASAQRIFEVLDAEAKIPEKENAVAVREFKSEIEYRQVGFAYQHYDNKKVLDSISVKIGKGKMVALVGPSGAGKTTFVDLLTRFYDVQEGAILMDGIDIRDYRLAEWRSLFGIVSQEPILFNDTVHNNITFGNETATRENVIEAARVANAHDFISKLEHGYDSIIGDRGGKLSGGEKQRLTIARAVLKNPPVLILDEATSSLDSNSEKLVQDALIKLMKGRTTIVIAHRLSTIQYADEIIVMQDGKIAERGNHIGLMAKNGLYQKLVELQAF